MSTRHRHTKKRPRSRRRVTAPVRARLVITIDTRAVARRVRRLSVVLAEVVRTEVARVLADCVSVTEGRRRG
jgi:hypothetical protein